MLIGELSQRTGVSARSLRYYEQQRLLRAERMPNGYREYDEASIEMVATIQDLLGAGLSTDVIRDILPCTTQERPHPAAACADLVARVVAIRDGLEQQAARITAHRERLDRYLTAGRRDAPPSAQASRSRDQERASHAS